MFSRHKLLAALIAVPAVIATTFVVLPAQAVSPGLVLSSPTVAIYKSGAAYYGKVFATCKASTTCTGKVWWAGDGTYAASYSIGAHKGTYIAVRMTTLNDKNPWTGSATHYDNTHSLFIDESRPFNRSQTADTLARDIVRRSSATVSGSFTGSGAAPVDVRATLYEKTKTQYEQIHADYGTSFSFTVPTGTNNGPSGKIYAIQVKGVDQDGQVRSWWWRGSNGVSKGGTKWLLDATKFTVPGAGYVVPVTYGAISGSVSASGASGSTGVDIIVAAPPPTYPTFSSTYYTTLRELDYEACGNSFGETSTTIGGSYSVGFLPRTPGTDLRYMVKASSKATIGGRPTMRLWNNEFRSCIAAIHYPKTSSNYASINNAGSSYRSDLIDLSDGGVTGHAITIEASTGHLTGHVSYSAVPLDADKWVRIREYLPYRKILDSPVVADKKMSFRDFDFSGLPPGKYWVEIGRSSNCEPDDGVWLPSRYSNNAAYFQGEDRSAESWKSFRHLSDLSSSKEAIAIAHGASTSTQNHVKSGYAGWMYRGSCKFTSAGGYYTYPQTFTYGQATGAGLDLPTKTISKGATISGHVTRSGGRTNKEMMVTAYSTAGTRVPRNALTNGSGNFTISGLDSGTWHIEVNADSWRGIGRKFIGPHTKSVTRGGSYSVGTLHAYL